MSDKKISQLTAATTPLAGTEVLPIVQSGSTVKVANNDLRPKQIQSNATSGVLQVTGPAAASTRVMTTPDANFTVARTDAGQTFTGSNQFNDNQALSSTLAAWGGSYRVWQIGYGAGLYSHTGIGAQGFTNNSYATNADERYINTAPASKYSTFQNNHYFYVAPSGTAGDPITWTEAFKIDSSANATISAGNLVIGTSGKGIDFSATAGTGTSELLNDYEEGTWTPALAFETPGDSSFGYNTQEGRYTKVGRQVTVNCLVRLNAFSKGTASGTLRITGLPYTAGSHASEVWIGSVGTYLTPFSNIPISTVSQNSAYINLLQISSNAGWASMSDPSSSSQYMVTITYFV